MFLGLHHAQLAMPVGEEDRARHFFVDVLGMLEIDKPATLAARGGVWFEAGGLTLHPGGRKALQTRGEGAPRNSCRRPCGTSGAAHRGRQRCHIRSRFSRVPTLLRD